MIALGHHIWTPRGWLPGHDLTVGDKVISYNPELDSTEFDVISEVELKHSSEEFLGIKFKGMNQLVSQDHPLMIVHTKDNKQERQKIEDVFLSSFLRGKRIVYNRLFDPYGKRKDLEELKKEARFLASFSSSKYDQYLYDYIDRYNDITALDAREWIETFFLWNIKKYDGIQWRYCSTLHNKVVRDIIFTIAPRAGFATAWGSSPRIKGYNVMRVSKTLDAQANIDLGWMKHPYVGHSFNIRTQNGSVLAKRNNGTFLMACNKT